MKRVLAPAAIRLERTEIELRVVFTNEKPFFFFFFFVLVACSYNEIFLPRFYNLYALSFREFSPKQNIKNRLKKYRKFYRYS